MPSFVHNVKIVSVSPASAVQNGDALLIAPTSSQKTYFGAGCSETGDGSLTFNASSTTNVNDADFVEGSANKAGTKT